MPAITRIVTYRVEVDDDNEALHDAAQSRRVREGLLPTGLVEMHEHYLKHDRWAVETAAGVHITTFTVVSNDRERMAFLDELAERLATLIQAGVTEEEVRADFEAQMSLQAWTDKPPDSYVDLQAPRHDRDDCALSKKAHDRGECDGKVDYTTGQPLPADSQWDAGRL